jgi:hypothetical protein
VQIQRVLAWIAGGFLIVAAAACGSGTADNQPIKPVQVQPQLQLAAVPNLAELLTPVPGHPLSHPLSGNPQAAGIFTCQDQTRDLSAAGFDPRELPSLPPLTASAAPAATRANPPVIIADLGNAYDSANCTPTTGGYTLAAPAGGIAWAIYEFPLGRYDEPYQAYVKAKNVSAGVWVGFSNYERGSWDFGTQALAFESAADSRRYTKNGYRNSAPATYVLLLTYDTGTADINDLELQSNEVIPAVLPGAWYTALANVGLGPRTPGVMSMIGEGLAYNAPFFTNYDDLGTMLPVFYSAWYTQPGDDYPEFKGPDTFPKYVRGLSEDIEDATTLQGLFLEACNEFPLAKRPVEQTSAPTLDETNPLAEALASYINALGGTNDTPALIAACSSMSIAQQNALAEVVAATQAASQQRQTTLQSIVTTFGFTEQNLNDIFNYTHGGKSGRECLIAPDGNYIPLVYNSENHWLAGWPYPDMFFNGTALMADAIDHLHEFVYNGSPAWTSINIDVATPAGQVVISGTGDDTHTAPGDGNGHALLIDLGGNDTYDCHAGGNASIKNGVSLCLDLGGDDVYNRLDDPDDGHRDTDTDDNTSQQGAGRYGIGMLVDFAGNDDYHSVRMSQGSAVMGVGILADYAGNDAYDMEALGQGGAFGGVGLLWDRSGDDSYNGYYKVQGCGLMMGVGWLVDSSNGVDTYYCEPTKDANRPEYATSEFDVNLTIGQGCGWGARDGWLPNSTDGMDGTVGCGGLGLLFDGGGDDNYIGSVFSMGAGYFGGIGLLLDRQGSDVRSTSVYSEGAAVHLGAAMLWDTAGDDQYFVDEALGLGGGQDYSLAWLIDSAGNDYYSAADAGLGCGTSNGVGYLLDLGGDDAYVGKAAGFQDACLGKGALGNTNRFNQPAYGIMLDLNGTDTYDPAFQLMLDSTGLPGDDASWTRVLEQNVGTPAADYTKGRGSGLDTTE